MTFQFAVLGSGSRGNSALFCHQGDGLLIDLGLGPRVLADRLASVGAEWSRIRAAVLTHTHGDHVDSAALRCMAKRGVPLYCHEGHRANLEADDGFAALDRAGLVRHYDDRPFMGPNGFRIEPIAARHDGGPTFGFRIETGLGLKRRGAALGYLADTGTWCDAMVEALIDVDVLAVEFNHDVALQRHSGRSPALIARNLGDRGHLSNQQGAELVAAVLERSRRDRIGHLVLLHLSQQCNTPALALQAAGDATRRDDRQTLIHAARQAPAHPNLRFAPSRSAHTWRTNGAGRSRPAKRPMQALAPLLPGFGLESA